MARRSTRPSFSGGETMFTKGKEGEDRTVSGRQRPASGSTFSVLASDIEITGNIVARTDLHIDGQVNGDVKCANLVQGRESAITGNVVAESARLGGTVEGSIEAADLAIEASARVSGDVTYERLTIEPGGQVEGQFRHRNYDEPPVRRMTAERAAEPLELVESTRG